MRGKGPYADPVVAAVSFVPAAAAAAAVVAGPGVAGCVGLSGQASCSAPGDSGGGWPH